MQSEDDCDGHETTRYAFYIGDKEVGNMTADMLGLSFFSKRGNMAVATMTVLTSYIANSSWFNLTVVLSNTVEFMEVTSSSTDGASSTLRSDIWFTSSDPFYCKFNPHGIVSCLFCLTKPVTYNLEHYEGFCVMVQLLITALQVLLNWMVPFILW